VKGFDDGVMDFIHRPEVYMVRKQNVSETGSAFVFRFGEGDTYSVGYLKTS
jgi:hypothetical protein